MPPQPGDSLETLYVDIAARADRLVQDAEAAVQAVVRKLGEIDAKTEETQSVFARLGDFIKQSLSVATGIGLANLGQQLVRSVVGFGKALIDTNAQMQTFEQSFTVLTGSAQEAGEIIDWVKEQAKATPFDVPGLIQASQQLMTWGLDLEEWFTVVGDTAAAMNRPLSQVVNAVGTLASGQTGEAVRRFRDLGINLREYTQLEFDAQGSLITPLEEAIPIVRQIMVDRFGGMMEAQSQTWAGVMSNLSDTWQQFVQVVGEPIFETLNEQLANLYQWVEENEEAIENFARSLGSLLSGALDVMLDLLGAMGNFLGQVDEALKALTGLETYLDPQRAATAARQVLALVTAPLSGIYAGLEVGAAAVRGEEVPQLGERLALHMQNIAGMREETDATEELTAAQIELTAAHEAGLRAVRNLADEYEQLAQMSDQEIVQALDGVTDKQIEVAEAFFNSEEAASRLPPLLRGLVEDNRELALSTIEVAHAYRDGVDQYEATITKAEEMAEAHRRLREEQETNLELAQEVGGKLADALREAMERYRETVAETVARTDEAIAEIQAEAAQAEAEALARHQDDVARLRDEFAREQLRRRRQFNLEWARLVRDQNQEVLDAEWEYEYQKRNLLIEGDEIALAELEARYAHEQEVRAREQGDARDDMRSRFDLENQERQEQMAVQLQALEARLQRELETIREKAQEEVQAKKEALDERLADEDAALEERLQKIGERLAREVGDNQTAANIILEAWRAAYGDQIAQSIQAGLIVRQELDAITRSAITAAGAVANVGRTQPIRRGASTGRTGGAGRRGSLYHAGGYTPGLETAITTGPGEWVADAPTTQALERALGGPLSQGEVRMMADSRRVLDVNINGVGVPADEIAAIRRELTQALLEENAEF